MRAPRCSSCTAGTSFSRMRHRHRPVAARRRRRRTPHADALTVSPAYAADAARRSARRCARGRASRPPSASATRRATRTTCCSSFAVTRGGVPSPPRLAAWAAAGRVEAVQLELGVPLRWPGRLSRAASCAPRGPRSTAPAHARSAHRPARQRASAAVDARERPSRRPPRCSSTIRARGIGLSARVDRAGGRRVAGRLLLFLGGERLALFIGEDRTRHGPTGDGPHFSGHAGRLRVALRRPGAAPATTARSTSISSRRFAASQLCSRRVDLRFARGLSATTACAAAAGSRSTACDAAIDAPGFARHGVLQRSAGALVVAAHAQRRLRRAARACALRHRVPRQRRVLRAHGDAATAARTCRR